jgi:hypothetical protein
MGVHNTLHKGYAASKEENVNRTKIDQYVVAKSFFFSVKTILI